MADTIRVEKGVADDSKGQPIQLSVSAARLEVKAEEAKVEAGGGGLPGPNIPRWMAEAEPGSPADRERQRRQVEWQQRQAIQPAAPPLPQPQPQPQPLTLPGAPPVPGPQALTQDLVNQQFARQQEDVRRRADFERERSERVDANRRALDQQYDEARRRQEMPQAPPPPPAETPIGRRLAEVETQRRFGMDMELGESTSRQWTGTGPGQGVGGPEARRVPQPRHLDVRPPEPPPPAAQIDLAEQQRQSQQALDQQLNRGRQWAGAATQAGVPGAAAAGNIIGGAQAGAAVGGPVGAAVGAAVGVGLELKKTLEGVIDSAGKFGVALAGSDVEGFQHELVAATKKIPLFGEGIAQNFEIITGINRALVGEAERIKGYNPALAVQSAQLGVERLQRDIERSYRFEAQYLAAQDAQANVERQFYELQGKYLPVIAKAAELGMKGIQDAIALAEQQLRAGVALFDLIAQSPVVNNNVPQNIREVVDQLRHIASNTAPAALPFDAGQWTRQLFQSLEGLEVSRAESEATQQLARQSRDVEAQRPLFGGL